ncbi:hypothetical protein SCHPADRAFT_926471 [Schizopora paradoxa]|uniref:MYND-type domain-containing protein n=1 Tax=Schizopora paradoxa TaxID=27342 RepID=A0A0H2RXI9_9AGAM|nr:hypothetical protein SCHPADRAFT_926471 [Schizopora paradoxa]
MSPPRSTAPSSNRTVKLKWRLPIMIRNFSKKEGEKQRIEIRERTSNVIQRASEGSMLDIVSLAIDVVLVPATHRCEVFSLFLNFLTDIDLSFNTLGPQQPVYAAYVLKVLLGIGQSASSVGTDQAMAQMLEENWKIVTRWVRRFCDNFNSASDPFKGASVTYHEWYTSLASALFVAHADRDRARQLWSDSDARHGLYRLWALSGSDLPAHVVKMCASIVGLVILHQYGKEEPASELVKSSGLGEEGVAHLCMTRMIKASKLGNVDDMRDDAYVLFALSTSLCDPLRTALLKKKAVPYLTRTFVKLANVDTIHKDTKNLDFVEKFLRVFEAIIEPEGAVTYFVQALRQGFLRGVINCGLLLDTLRYEAVDALKNIIGYLLITYLSHHSILLAALDTLSDIDQKDIERHIGHTVLKPLWMNFEQYILERSASKALFERCIQSDLSTLNCGQCGKRDVKNNFQKCAGCLVMHYCSKDCQAKHWKEGGHRVTCKKISGSGGGWDRRDRRFSEFITVYDVQRHAEDLHRMAVQKFGIQQVPMGKTPPYGCSVDYKTVPPTLDVFKLEDEIGEDELPYFKAKGDKLDEAAETRGSEGFLAKFILPRGASSLGQILHGHTGLRRKHLWQRDRRALESTYGPPSRWNGIDKNGVSLRPVSDEIDSVINKIPLEKVRVGDYFRWSSHGQREGQANVLDEIARIADSAKEKDLGKKIVVTFEFELES